MSVCLIGHGLKNLIKILVFNANPLKEVTDKHYVRLLRTDETWNPIVTNLKSSDILSTRFLSDSNRKVAGF